MSQELHYTSVPRGLKPGSRGFCTVACTPQMSGPLVERLESLSGYQPVYPVHDPAASRNPINFAHIRLTIGGKSVSVLSRLGLVGLDDSGRPNKYAHHVVLESNERPQGGPAWLLSQPRLHADRLGGGAAQSCRKGGSHRRATGPRGSRAPGRHSPATPAGPESWPSRSWPIRSGRRSWSFGPEMDLLPLFVEAIALLPPSRRWDVEFSTYFTTLPHGVTCPWRGMIAGSPEAENALRLPNALVINLGGDSRQSGRRRRWWSRLGTGVRPASPVADTAASSSRSPGRLPGSAAGQPTPTAGGPRPSVPAARIDDRAGSLPGAIGRPTDRPHRTSQYGRPRLVSPRRSSPDNPGPLVAGIVALSVIGMVASGFFVLQPCQGRTPRSGVDENLGHETVRIGQANATARLDATAGRSSSTRQGRGPSPERMAVKSRSFDRSNPTSCTGSRETSRCAHAGGQNSGPPGVKP